MITLFDQNEVWEDYIASDWREQDRKSAKNFYANDVSIDVIVKFLGYSVKTIEKWLGFVL